MEAAAVWGAVKGTYALVREIQRYRNTKKDNKDDCDRLHRRRALLEGMAESVQQLGASHDDSGNGCLLQRAASEVVQTLRQVKKVLERDSKSSMFSKLVGVYPFKDELARAEARLSSTMADLGICVQLECFVQMKAVSGHLLGPAPNMQQQQYFAAKGAAKQRLALDGPPPAPLAAAPQQGWQGREQAKQRQGREQAKQRQGRDQDQVASQVQMLAMAVTDSKRLVVLNSLRGLLAACPSHQTAIAAAGCVQALVQLLLIAQSANVREQAAALLGELVGNHPANQDACSKDPSVFAALVGCLRSSCPQLQQQATMALCNLSANHDVNQRLIAKADGIPALLHLLTFGTSKAALEVAAVTLCSLANTSSECREAIVKSDGVPALVNALHSASQQLQMFGAHTIAMLCLDEWQLAVLAADGVSALQHVAHNSGSGPARWWATEALRCLSGQLAVARRVQRLLGDDEPHEHWTDAMVDPGSVLAAVCMAAKVVKAAYDWMEQKERNTNASGQLQERGAEAQLRLKYIKEHVDTEDEVLAGVLKRGIDQVIKALAAAGEIMEKYSSKNKLWQLVNVKQLTYELHMSEKRIDRAHAELSLAIHLRTASKVDGMAARVHSMDRRTANRLEGIEVALQRLSTQGSDVLTPITPAHSEGQQQWQQLLQGAGSGGTVDPQVCQHVQSLEMANTDALRLASLRALHNLLTQVPAHQAAMGEVGCIEQLADVLVRGGDANVLTQAASLLGRLVSNNPGNQERCVGCQTMFHSLTAHLFREAPQLQQEAATALCNLSAGHSGNQQQVCAVGGISTLLSLLSNGGSSTSRKLAALTLGKMVCISEFFLERIVAAGGVADLVDALSSDSCLEVRTHAAHLVAMLPMSKHRAAVSDDQYRAALRHIARHSTSERKRRWAAEELRRLPPDPQQAAQPVSPPAAAQQPAPQFPAWTAQLPAAAPLPVPLPVQQLPARLPPQPVAAQQPARHFTVRYAPRPVRQPAAAPQPHPAPMSTAMSAPAAAPQPVAVPQPAPLHTSLSAPQPVVAPPLVAQPAQQRMPRYAPQYAECSPLC
ncbi:hypothetical protein D9Q98_000158 [Chlorella vulgaris]|uniref:Vacuolar protein 8 n=1 Tax=Chlorella vulgaris TaxID=3077 RepID=A0A9D4Z1D4_CHLVU|nr:hypothetical protein D9Q98_000158 [Chlorella vulgaris]